MDYTDVYFLQDTAALVALLIGVAIACYWAHRRYRRKGRETRGMS